MYRPEKPFLLSLGFELMKTTKDVRYQLTIASAKRSLYFLPLYGSFRYGSGVYFYPRSDSALRTIIESLSPQN